MQRKLENAISRAMLQIHGDKNLLSLSDEEVILAYKHTRLDNYTFTNYISKMCNRSALSIRAMLVRNRVYRKQTTKFLTK